MSTSDVLRVGLIGHGAIGSVVAGALRSGSLRGCELAGIVTRSGEFAGRVDSIAELSNSADVIVEAAGHDALANIGPEVTRRGVDLLVVSVGALVDNDLLSALQHEDGGRVLISTGAIGGLDLLRAAGRLGPLNNVSLQSTKPTRTLVQPWMPEDLVTELHNSSAAMEVFKGTAREAATQFPKSANVAATLGLATVGLDQTEVSLVGDPDYDKVRHIIRAVGEAGTYEISIENRPSQLNHRTSAITPYAVIRALEDMRANMLFAV